MDQNVQNILKKAGISGSSGIGYGTSSTPSNVDAILKKAGIGSPASSGATTYQPQQKQGFSDKLITAMNQPEQDLGLFGHPQNPVLNAVNNFSTGVAKGVLRTGAHIGQFIAPQIGLEGESIFNSASEKGKQFNEAAKGKTTGAKVGATAFDIGMLGAPVGEIGTGISKLAEGIPTVAKYASQVGAAGKLARFAPKAAGAIGEGYAANTLLTGNPGVTDENGNVNLSNVVLPLAPMAIGATGRILGKLPRLVTEEGRAGLAKEGAEAISKGLKEGNATTIGSLAEQRNKFVKTLSDALENGGVRPATVARRADTKLGNLENKAAASGIEYTPDDRTVFEHIFDNGMLDGLNARGKAITTNGQAKQAQYIQQLAEESKKLFDSSPDVLDGGKLSQNIMNSLESQRIGNGTGSKTGQLVEQEKNILRQLIQEQPQLQMGGEVTPGELFDISKSLRDQAYVAEGKQKDTVTANVYRAIAGKIDDILFKNPNLGIDLKTANQLRRNQATAYAVLDTLKALEKTKFTSGTAQFFGELLGAATGYAQGGFIGSGVGRVLGGEAVDAIHKAYANKNISNKVIENLANNATNKELIKLRSMVAENVAKNKVRAKEKSIRDFVDKIISGPKQLPAPKDKTIRTRFESGPTINVPKGGFSIYESKAQKINRQKPKIQDYLLLPSGNTETIPGKTIRLPQKFSNLKDYIGK